MVSRLGTKFFSGFFTGLCLMFLYLLCLSFVNFEPKTEVHFAKIQKNIAEEAIEDSIYSSDGDDEDFKNLVNQFYDEDDLYKWEPAPPGANTLDTRHSACLSTKYPEKLPQTSVIIVIRNEELSVLMQTIWNIYNNSPRELLKEIVLVDVASDNPELGEKLEESIKFVPVPIVLQRLSNQMDLIKARYQGAEVATASVITFADTYTEYNVGWLEPLLALIAKDRTTAATPASDFENSHDFLRFATFDWTFMFAWQPPLHREINRTNNEANAVYRPPVMSGRVFSIDRQYFYAVGGFDNDMTVFSPDDIEISLRIWTCGGSIQMPLCSHVSYFAKQQNLLTGSLGESELLLKNTARIVDVWADEYAGFFYTLYVDAVKLRTSVTIRKNLREHLKCKSFQWYLTNVYPESILNSKLVGFGYIKNRGFDRCLDAQYSATEGDGYLNEICHHNGGNQIFLLTEIGEIRSHYHCLDVNDKSVVLFSQCRAERASQKWFYNNQTLEIVHTDGAKGSCLTISENQKLALEPCVLHYVALNQKWEIIESVF